MLCKYPGETCANMIFHHSKVYCNNEFCHLHDDPPLRTNADWIRGMSDEELAMFLKEEMFNDFKPSCSESTFFSAENRPECDTGCVPCILNWLRQPVDNGVSSQNVKLISRNEYIEEIKETGIIGKWDSVPLINIPALISWLNDQKYIDIDETRDNMTEEFEREHQWELSRNCFINKMIRKLEELK